MSIGNRIKQLRTGKKFSQEYLAEKLDVDRTTISKIELATSGVSLDVIFDIADLFGIPAEKLFEFR